MWRSKHIWIYSLAVLMVVSYSCEKPFDIEVKGNKPLLVVEAYVNNQLPLYNYVMLTSSVDYFSPTFEAAAVNGASVHITEGILLTNNVYQWDNSTKIALKEVDLPGGLRFPGLYIDPMIQTDTSRMMKGKPGKSYLLEIEYAGKHYSSITSILPVIPIDSLTNGFHFLDEDDGVIEQRARITLHYQDPDTIGNSQLYFWQRRDNRNNFGWGGLGNNRFTNGSDDLVNGQYIHLTQSNSFVIGDTVTYYLSSVERGVFNFWESYVKARNNGGPFATPVALASTIKGEDVVGCFSGMSLSSKTIIVQ